MLSFETVTSQALCWC